MNKSLKNKHDSLIREQLQKAKDENYYGYNKHDGLLSPFIARLFSGSKTGRLLGIQFVMRFPWNLRPVLGIPKTRNPKGIGLFAHANLDAYTIFGEKKYLDDAINLLGWLQQRACRDFPGLSWGYQYPWQDVGFFAPADFPNRVVACWIGFAFFRAYQVTGGRKCLDACQKICKFLLETPNRIKDTSEELCFSYVPDEKVHWAVMDVSALCGKMFALTGSASEDRELLNYAGRCIRYIVNRQTDYGGWYYTDPPKDSYITHDNYHTGIILDCLYDYMQITGIDKYWPTYEKGLAFYRDHLFLENGAPKWMNNKIYPHDIHGAAQGIITFSKVAARYPDSFPKAERILEWTMQNLYNKKTGRFLYQKHKFFTKKFTLMRWCTAWMARAICEFEIGTGKRS